MFLLRWLEPLAFWSPCFNIARWARVYLYRARFWLGLCERNTRTFKDVESAEGSHPYLDEKEGAHLSDVTNIPENNIIHTVHYLRGEFLGLGASGFVELLEDGTVLKAPLAGPDYEESCKDIEFEAEIYRLLGRQDRLVEMTRHSSEGLVLEYMSNGDLKTYLEQHTDVSTEQRLRWVRQATEGVELLHSHNVLHCDTKPRNFLLDTDLNLRIIDFSGSTFIGSQSTSCQSTRYYLPRHWKDLPTTTTDLFALGSTIYEIITGVSPYEDLSSTEVRELYRDKVFPDVSSLPCRDVIMKCWKCEIASAREVLDLIAASPDTVPVLS